MLSALPSDVLVDVIAGLLVGSIGGFFVWFARQLKGVSRMTKDWNGEPARPGISNGKPGVMQRLYTQDEQFTAVLERLGKQDVVLADIRHEVFPNSGKSIKDITDKTHNDLTEHIKRSEEWRESVEARLENPDAP
jgi:hypothetical protein